VIPPPSAAAPAHPARRAVRDAILAGLCVVAGGALFIGLDVAERVERALLRWEALQLDDLLLTSVVAVAALTWFSWRRWRDAVRELQARQASEAEKARYVLRLEELSTELLETEERERARISELLHDEVGQTLYACLLQLERLDQRLQDSPLHALLAEARALAAAAMAHTRELTLDLSPPVLHDLGLSEAIEWLLRRSHERLGVRARFEPSEHWQRIPKAWHAAVFHSVSELLANAAKHARASQVGVSAADSGDGSISVRVHDDGSGFSANPVERGFGLFSVERRMAFLGAELSIESTPGSGTCATLRLPVPTYA
jgi:signal transduction histidine kinase